MNNFDEIFAASLAQYRAGEFEKAINSFSAIIEVMPDEWNSRLYLAMAHYKAGQTATAAAQMEFIKTRCPDPEIRIKAEHSGRLLTVEMTKPTVKPAQPADAAPQNTESTPEQSGLKNTSENPLTNSVPSYSLPPRPVAAPRKPTTEQKPSKVGKLQRATGEFVKAVYKSLQTMSQGSTEETGPTSAHHEIPGVELSEKKERERLDLTGHNINRSLDFSQFGEVDSQSEWDKHKKKQAPELDKDGVAWGD